MKTHSFRISVVFFIFFTALNHGSSVNRSESDNSRKNKFRERKATDDSLGYPEIDEDALLITECPQKLELRWQTEVSSSIYSSPLIADINSDGKPEVVLSSFVHYLEILEGSDGDKLPGWPAFHKSTVHSSPLLYDIDKDGIREIALATYNGEVIFFRISGHIMSEKLIVPRRKVKKNWYVGLHPDPADRSHPDVHDDLLIEEAIERKSSTNSSGNGLDYVLKEHADFNNVLNTTIEKNKNDSHVGNTTNLIKDIGSATFANISTRNESSENVTNTRRRLLESNMTKGALEHGSESEVKHDDTHVSTVENDEGLGADADSSFDLFRDTDEFSDDYNYDYDDYFNETMWGEEEWFEQLHENVEDYVHIDAHILSTPVIADIDGDGITEMVIAVSYFFDREYYDNQEHLKDLGDIDVGKYVAGSIVVFDLNSKQVKWITPLDISTDSSEFRAYIYSSPTVVDLDGDGCLDIVVGTSYGLFYVLDHNGKVREKFPLEMAEIHGVIAAADINDDGKIEMVTTDAHGNVAAWSANGEELWETHLKSFIPQGPSVGDVDGDGNTDIVVTTSSGKIYVLNGTDGSILHPYPFTTHGQLMNKALLVDLSRRGDTNKGLTIVTTSFDGYLYLIYGPTSCADVVDIGEMSYSMVLADNIDGGDDLNLLVTTMNGNVLCFSTSAAYHPLKAWRAPTQGRNNVATRYGREGVYVLPASRMFRDEGGSKFWVEIDIVDVYRFSSGAQGPYNVTVSLLVPENYQNERRVVLRRVFYRAGRHRVELPVVTTRAVGTVVVEMTDRNGLYFSDEFVLTFHIHFYRIFKWLLALPMLGMLALLLVIRPQETRPLPSFSRSSD